MDRFYKDFLGFRPCWHGATQDQQTDWVSLQVPEGTAGIEVMINVPLTADKPSWRHEFHRVGVPDIHAAAKQLLTNDMQFTEQPKLAATANGSSISTIPTSPVSN